jgi:hypothetical protein
MAQKRWGPACSFLGRILGLRQVNNDGTIKSRAEKLFNECRLQLEKQAEQRLELIDYESELNRRFPRASRKLSSNFMHQKTNRVSQTCQLIAMSD